MPTFKSLKSHNDLKEIIQSAFSTSLAISGSWGYTQEQSTILHHSDTPLIQLEHIFASMRAYLEMNMTQEKEDRYGSINVNEFKREEIYIDSLVYHKVTYTISAMQESTYNQFINEYKENYGKEDFDLEVHFNKRKATTLIREVIHWFEVHKVLQT